MKEMASHIFKLQDMNPCEWDLMQSKLLSKKLHFFSKKSPVFVVYFILFHVWVFTCVCLCAICEQYLRRPEEGGGSLVVNRHKSAVSLPQVLLLQGTS